MLSVLISGISPEQIIHRYFVKIRKYNYMMDGNFLEAFFILGVLLLGCSQQNSDLFLCFFVVFS